MLRDLIRVPAGAFAVGAIAVIIVLAVAGPLLSPFDPLRGSDLTLAGPSAEHLLGTDHLGRDVLSRLLHGAQLSLLGAVQVAVIGLVVGAIPGVLSVFLGRAFEWLSLRLIDTLIALPFLIFAVALTALMGNGIPQAMLAVGILVSPLFFRVARAAALSVVGSPYVEAAHLAGATTWFVVRHHVVGKVLPPVAIALASVMGVGLVVVASLSFLGVGVQPPTPTWGGELASDLRYLPLKPYAPLFPATLIVVTVLAFNFLADALRDVTGPSRRHADPPRERHAVHPESEEVTV